MKIKPYHFNPKRVCSRCVMDDSVKGITFDKNGVCIFCRIHDEFEAKYPMDEKTSSVLQSVVADIKQKGKGKQYDCIIGVSGGRDSTFTLYNAVKLGLRPLAVHFDNGWNSEIAVKNIENACSKLNVDLHTHVADWEEFKDFQRSFLLASVPDAEVPTDWVITSVLFEEACTNGVQYIIHGHSFRTEGTPPLSWTYMDGKYVNSIQNQYGTKKLKSFPSMGTLSYLKYSLLKRIKQIRLLYYIPYDEKRVMELLQTELCWENYGDKHHESVYTAFFQSYILTRKFNIDKRKLHYSAKIRTGQILREDAVKIINKDPFVGDLGTIKYCLKKLDFTEEEFEAMMSSEPKSFRNFSTNYDTIMKMKKLVMIGIKLGFVPDTVEKKYYYLDNA